MFDQKVIKQFEKFNNDGKPFTVWGLVTATGLPWSGGSNGAAHQVIRMIQQGYGPAAGCTAMVVVPPKVVADDVKATRYNKWPEDNGSLLAIFSQEYLNRATTSFINAVATAPEVRLTFSEYLHDRLVADLWPGHVKTVGQVAQELTTPAPVQAPEASEVTEKETITTFTSVAKAAEWITAECRKMGDDQRFTVNARTGVFSGYLSDFRVDAAISKAAVEKALKAKLA